MIFKNFWANTYFRRLGIIVFSGVTILGTASSCALPSFLGGSQPSTTTFGVIKKDPEVRDDGLFVRANAAKNLKGEIEQQGISTYSVLKLVQINKDILFALTKEKGLFKTIDSGITWQRLYPIKVNGAGDNSGISRNDNLIVNDFAVDINQDKTIYISAKENTFAKVYQSLDGGENFKEVYIGVETGIGALLVTLDPVNPQRIYAVLEKGALIRSLDAGVTWQKIRSFKDIPIQIGFVPEFGNLLYILFATDGLAVSKDNGENFDINLLKKSASSIGEQQPKDGLDLTFSNSPNFGKYEKIIPVTAGLQFDFETKKASKPDSQSWILIADRQMWFSESSKSNFQKLVLPLQSEQYNLADAAPDPSVGLNKIYASIDNQLFVTRNRGQSWSIQQIAGFNGNIGNIGSILIDKTNSEIMYLGLLNSKARRNSGFFIF